MEHYSRRYNFYNYFRNHFFTPDSHSKIKKLIYFTRKLLTVPLYLIATILTNSKIGRTLIYNSFPPNSLVICNTADGLRYIVNNNDKSIGLYTFRNKLSYEFMKINAVFKLLNFQKIDTFVDIGANLGSVGMYAVHNNIAVNCISIEPDPDNFFLLKQNISLNNLTDYFETYNCAISNSNKKQLFMLKDDFVHGDHRVIDTEIATLKRDKSNKLVKVRTRKLDDILVYKDNMLIWIDTQGFELHVINSGKKLLENTPPLVTEFCPELMRLSNSLDEFLELMSASKYSNFVNLDEPNNVQECNFNNLKKLSDKLSIKSQHCDLLFIKN